MHKWAFQIRGWGLEIGDWGLRNRLEYVRMDWNRLDLAGIGGNRHISAYSSLFKSIPAYSSLCQPYYSLFKSIPAYRAFYPQLDILPVSSLI